MKNSNINLSLNDLPALSGKLLAKLTAYRVFLFFLAVASLYGYIIWRINVYSNAPASQSEETAQSTPQPRIDAATIEKIQNLQDNSVNVKSAFAAARQNPFQENQ